MNTLNDFFENARQRNLCDRGAKVWEHCKSKKSLIDYALSGWGCDYLATAIMNGWSIDPQVIKEDFSMFNNGKYIRDKDGYTSTMYCLPEAESITITSTLTLIIGFNGRIIIPKGRIGELYLCKSNVTIEGGCKNTTVYLYGSSVDNTIDSSISLVQK